jgi:hypothetical protein
MFAIFCSDSHRLHSRSIALQQQTASLSFHLAPSPAQRRLGVGVLLRPANFFSVEHEINLAQFAFGVRMIGNRSFPSTNALAFSPIILDFSMSRINVLQAAFQASPDTPIILFASHNNTVLERLAHNVGAASAVSKTDQLTFLADEVERLTASPN